MSSDITGATGLTGRYATALFELADEEKQLDEIAGELASINNMIEDNSDLQRLIRSPTISRKSQLSAMDSVLRAAGFGETIRKFVGVVIQNGRLFAIQSMIKGYQTILAKHRNEATVELITAKVLTMTQMDTLEKSIKQALGTKVTIQTKVDESLLGGLVLKIGSRMIDTSLKTKLGQLRLAMKGVG